MNVLAISTSTPRGSVAVVAGDRVLAEAAHDDPRGHAEHVFALADEVLARAGLSRTDLHLVACDIGPGSFTGVRIAVASAKGIAVGLGLPLAGVGSLEAMAAQARAGSPGGPSLVAAAIDAKKGELYVAVYDGDSARLPPSHLPVGEAAARVAQAVAGEPFVSIVDAPAFESFALDPDRAEPPANLVRRLVAAPSAAWVARIAVARHPDARDLGAGVPSALDPSEVVPLYVRAPDAVPSISGTPGPFDMLPAR